MKPRFLHLALAIAGLGLELTASFAQTPTCDWRQITRNLDRSTSRTQRYEARVHGIESACGKGLFRLCSDASLSSADRETFIRAAAQLDDVRVRESFLNSFPPKNQDDLNRLLDYAKRRVQFCTPPVDPSCASDRWQSVFEDYLARNGNLPGARFLRRWSEDDLEKRIPGLGRFLRENAQFKESAEKSQAYEKIISGPGMSADSMSIISEQSFKKRLNDVNKALSDALGNARMRMFRSNFEQALADQGLSLPSASRVDFKTDRMIEPLEWLREEHPRQLEQAVNQAATKTNAEFARMVETRFPELMYVGNMHDPASWYNTASFSLPGFSPRMNEALAAFKARTMRTGPALTNEKARDGFVTLAKQVVASADDLRGHRWLITSGVIEANGTFSRATAGILRKLSNDGELARKINEVFRVQLSEREQALILKQWKSQDLLSLPLMSVDQMGKFPKDSAILGGDGVAGGAVDAWSKVTALVDRRTSILAKASANDQAKNVFNALAEADQNASAIIRSAPTLLSRAVERLPASVRDRAGVKPAMTSADDAIISMENLMKLNTGEREVFYRSLAQQISEQKANVTISRNGASKTEAVGPEILRAFIGFDKASAESAETFLKPFEERVAQAGFLGPNWRDRYPNVAFLAVREGAENYKIYVAGKSLNPAFKETLKRALKTAVRDPSSVELIFDEPAHR